MPKPPVFISLSGEAKQAAQKLVQAFRVEAPAAGGWEEGHLPARERARLVRAARAAARKSYSPYSRFRVGASVMTPQGIFSGANVENASYGLCLCAERAALAAAIAAGASEITAICVSCIDAKRGTNPGELMPCGACRQWLIELAPKATIVVDGIDRTFTANELMASPFTLRPRR